jgi:hypothetical protein
MRFLYGLILGILASVIAAILYLALVGGEYLLILSPKYQEMRSRLIALEKAEAQRDQLADRLRDLERRFTELSARFSGIADETSEPPAPPPVPSPSLDVPAPEGMPEVPPVEPTPEA